MKMKLSALFMAALLTVPAIYPMDGTRSRVRAAREAEAAQQQNQPQANAQVAVPAQQPAAANPENISWVPKVIRENRAVQVALVAATLGGAAYAFTEPMLSFGSTYARRILLNSQNARWLTLAAWNVLYDNCPTCADWVYFQALV